jgi:hypothetical protein
VVGDHDDPGAWVERIVGAPADSGAGRAWVEAEADADGMAARYLALWRRLRA